jgi:predicted enzyme related to lactoylglutathione lyase
MHPIKARFVGVELYFNDLEGAKKFYEEKARSYSSA